MLSDGKKCTLEPKLNGVVSYLLVSQQISSKMLRKVESKRVDCGPETLTDANEIDMPHYSFYTW